MVAHSAASNKSKTGALQLGAGEQKRFKGVRMRSWGKWVSEIRLPNTRARLWLGSYATAEQAARAFDVAVVCLRGRSAALNFPDSPPAYAPLGLSQHQIQELAASAAASSATSSSLAPTPFDSSASQVDSPNSAVSDESEALSWDQCLSTSAETEDMSGQCLSTSAETEDMSGQCSSLSSRSEGSDESEADTTNEINTRRCSLPVSTAHESGTLEDLLLLDEVDDEQSSPLSSSPFAALQDQEQALNSMVSEWEDLLWGVSISSYSPWDQHLLLFPPLPVDDDLPAISLWSL